MCGSAVCIASPARLTPSLNMVPKMSEISLISGISFRMMLIKSITARLISFLAGRKLSPISPVSALMELPNIMSTASGVSDLMRKTMKKR